jgi:hypothetical protein
MNKNETTLMNNKKNKWHVCEMKKKRERLSEYPTPLLNLRSIVCRDEGQVISVGDILCLLECM